MAGSNIRFRIRYLFGKKYILLNLKEFKAFVWQKIILLAPNEYKVVFLSF